MTVWGGIFYNGLVDFEEINRTMLAKFSCDVLQTCFLSNQDGILEEDWILQQENASVHTAYYTMEWLQSNDVDVMNWPAKPPDLNIIENVRGALVRIVYTNGRQFNDVYRLQEAIISSWNK